MVKYKENMTSQGGIGIIPEQVLLALLEYSLNRSVLTNKAGLMVKMSYGNERVFAGRYGLLAECPFDTRFPVGSISKVKVLGEILSLVSEGKVVLNEQIKAYLPWLADSAVGQKQIFTIFNHSTGLSRDGLWGNGITPEYPSEVELRAYVRECSLVEDIVWKYSNIGFEIARMIIESVTGRVYPNSLSRKNDLQVSLYGFADEGSLIAVPHEDPKAMTASIGQYMSLDEIITLYQSTVQKYSKFIFDEQYRVERAPEPVWLLGVSEWQDVKEEVYHGHQGNGYGYSVKVAVTQSLEHSVVIFSNVIKYPVHEISNKLLRIAKLLSATKLKSAVGWKVTKFQNRTLALLVAYNSESAFFFREGNHTFYDWVMQADGDITTGALINRGGTNAFIGEIATINQEELTIGPYKLEKKNKLL